LFQGREAFVKKVLKERYPTEGDKTTLSADEMSEFYRDFLNSKWSQHLNFNIEWQKRNARVLLLSAVVCAEKLFKASK